MFQTSRAVVSVMGGIALLIPMTVRADVIQVGFGDSAWVAGGPTEGRTPTADEGLAYTHATAAAGPAAWRSQVAALAAKYDISPALLEAVVWQESRWREAVTSRAGAYGLAQLMPATAREMGVDRADPAANLEGGARYLRLQLDAFGGDVEKALAAYNAGPGRVRRAGGIPAIRETQSYVAAILSRLSDPVRR